MSTAAATMPAAMSAFTSWLALAALLGLPFVFLVLRAVVVFDRGPVALPPGERGGRIALRPDEDPPPCGGGSLAFTGR